MNEKTPPTAIADIPSLLRELGIPEDYGREPPRRQYSEAKELVEAGPNLLGRMQRLTPAALRQWQLLEKAATSDGLVLLLISGFRSVIYQADIIRNKLKAGQTLDEILKVSAAPGFSQHHTGMALDIASPGTRPLTEEFEHSPAFAWLIENAKTYGFTMTYPRNNSEGFVFEPWHWACEAGD
ncbi:MAG: M15 family metallopeptidase [Pseudomonadota bacterium]